METENGDDENSENVFFFESEHLALRGNQDYNNVLRTIILLEAQKIRVHSDIEELILCKNKYLNDIPLFMKKIKNNEELVLPNYMTLATIPEVSSCYDFPGEATEKPKPSTSLSAQIVRGRAFDQSKPETFNQLWTCEEQRRLEQLLIEYPVEPIEMRRFTKIANALGNRTPLQVASRVQKFFKKLYSAGMPVPGRIPKSIKNPFHRKQNYKSLYKPSTFFPAHNVPVNIPEDDYDIKNVDHHVSLNDNYQKMEFDFGEKDKSDKLLMIRMLQTIRDEKRNTSLLYKINEHTMKCENCLDSPVVGVRWFCNTCCIYINHCADCIVNHLLTNKFEHISHDVISRSEEVI